MARYEGGEVLTPEEFFQQQTENGFPPTIAWPKTNGKLSVGDRVSGFHILGKRVEQPFVVIKEIDFDYYILSHRHIKDTFPEWDYMMPDYNFFEIRFD